MSFYCKIKHIWEYYKDDVDILHKYGEKSPTFSKKVWVRKCERCGKKQEGIIGSGIYNFKIRKYVHWHNIKLTKSEEREQKLKRLGI